MTAPITPATAGQLNRPVPAGASVRSNRAGLQLAGMRILYIGQPLTGKTTYMLTYPGLVMLQADPESTTLDGCATELPVVDISNWDKWRKVLTLLQRREHFEGLIHEQPGFENYPIRGLALDSWTGFAEMAEARGMKEAGDDTQSGYGKLLRFCQEAKTILFELTKGPNPYYLLGAVHELEKLRSMTIEKAGGRKERVEVLETVLPSIAGRFGKNFFSYWSACLWTIKDIPATADGGLVRGRQIDYHCRTDQIDAFRCGFDRLNRLPAKVSGDYPTLSRYWFGDGSADVATSQKEPKK